MKTYQVKLYTERTEIIEVQADSAEQAEDVVGSGYYTDEDIKETHYDNTEIISATEI